ncbi:MAG: SWIM zinc finger domain-containing protein, partial [Planctomycetes bacterium]|nr:SWIM zinc finger domain-containing protein [Planctomycetota bacterium]
MTRPLPPLRWDVDWLPDLRDRWCEELDLLLEDLADLAGRGRSRRDGVGELRVTSAEVVAATVQGRAARPYQVRLRLDGPGDLFAECSCPYAASEGDCKHVWAVADRLLACLQTEVAPPTAASPVEELARLLDAAAAVAEPEAADRYGRTTRIVWRARLTGVALPVVEPYEQQRRADGSWTAGRRVSFEQLSYYARVRPSPDVRAVGRLVEYLGPGLQMGVDGRRALEALEGAPGVVDADAPDRHLRVVRGEVAVRLLPDPDGLRLEAAVGHLPLAYPPEPADGACVAHDAAAGLVLVGRAPRRAAPRLG